MAKLPLPGREKGPRVPCRFCSPSLSQFGLHQFWGGEGKSEREPGPQGWRETQGGDESCPCPLSPPLCATSRVTLQVPRTAVTPTTALSGIPWVFPAPAGKTPPWERATGWSCLPKQEEGEEEEGAGHRSGPDPRRSRTVPVSPPGHGKERARLARIDPQDQRGPAAAPGGIKSPRECWKKS